MQRSRTIEGRWWLTGNIEEEPHFGILSFDPEKGLELSIKIPSGRTNYEVMMTAANPISIPEIIHGRDVHDQPITLFGCKYTHVQNSCGMLAYTLLASFCLLGSSHNAREQATYSTAEVHYSLLHRWVDRNLLSIEKLEDGWPAYTTRLPEELVFTLRNGSRIRIDGDSSLNNSSEGLRIGLNHRVFFHLIQETDTETFQLNYDRPFRHLLSFLTGEPVYTESIFFHPNDPFNLNEVEYRNPVELLVWNRGVISAKRDVLSPFMIATFPELKRSFEQILQRWFDLYESLRPALDLHFIILFGRGLYLENQFLFLAQALEVLHQRLGRFQQNQLDSQVFSERRNAIISAAPKELQSWLKEKLAFANSKTLAQRLSELLAENENIMRGIMKMIPNFAEHVRNNRNYFTHFSESLKAKGKVANHDLLHDLTQSMHCLLQVVILKEIGVPVACIQKLADQFEKRVQPSL